MPSSMLLQTLGKRRHVDMARSTPTKSRPSWTSPTINGITLTSTGTMSTEWTHCKPRPLGSKVLAANWQPRAGRESSDLRTSHGHGSCISGHCVNVWATHGKPTQVAHHLENPRDFRRLGKIENARVMVSGGAYDPKMGMHPPDQGMRFSYIERPRERWREETSILPD
ncbi:hypothetical protein MGG_15171 [Pyricularia oryzae 70-15]|uniref:Uncharacterized protein n=1 Tax=Pyricularia oryzae (strain 70-15 / ATCC MYA-4617 / FGSC 8958) TaxID=242507 RepID=G4MQ07_PYRO7|nr:uncharacterized protein MGG_15171 [Pyricularia oryzae 70-15]EHA58095.1 hypothetical protein MGG_15171 [Pyricularia oryzae 70-15]